MTIGAMGTGKGDEESLPIGRRVALWRTRRKMSQQRFADRLGKSKSWVDKVERGVRRLDKVGTIQQIGEVLQIDTALLIGRGTPPVDVVERRDGVERVRRALSTYEIALAGPTAHAAGLDDDRMAGAVEYAWRVYQHARYPNLVRLLPNLIATAQRTHAHDRSGGRAALVDAYRVTASLLLKLGEADLAWLAADRAMATATGDVALVAAASIQIGQVLRATDGAQAALSVVLPAAYRIAPPDLDDGLPGDLSLCGTLLVQAALAAARQGDEGTITELIGEAAEIADLVGDGHDYHHTNFGPAAVHLARVTAAVELGDGHKAVAWHEKTPIQSGWRCLPAEHRAGYLLDVAHAYLQANDPVNAGRVLVDAHRVAPFEVRDRPAAHAVLAAVVREPAALPAVAHLASSVGFT